MGDFDITVTGRYGRANDALDAEQVEANGSSHDVRDRIDGTDFMKVNLLNRRTVDLRLWFREFAKDASRQLLLPDGERAAVDHRRDVVQVAMLMFGLMLDGDLRGAK